MAVVGDVVHLVIPLHEHRLGDGPNSDNAEDQCSVSAALTDGRLGSRHQTGGRHHHQERNDCDRDVSVDVFHGRFLLAEFLFLGSCGFYGHIVE